MSAAVRAASLCSWYDSSRTRTPCRSSSLRVCRVSSQSTTSASASSRSTRNVTSSRFPIGVAQTASGMSALAQRLECDHPRADHACLHPELGRNDTDSVSRRDEALNREHFAGRR